MAERIEVKVFPKSSREEIVETDGIIKIYVKAAPDKGKANAAVLKIIAKKYKTKKNKIKIIAGLTNKRKVVEISKE
ncbi:MAG: DUF167 domain-containing protein [Candidatus Omnitrophota bacterium]